MSVLKKLFRSAYCPDEQDKAVFGEKYSPPEEFEHAKWYKVADYPKQGGDGQPAEVYECRWPAQFYKVVALPSTNSVGRRNEGWALSTGSGYEMARLAVKLAEAAADGMIGVPSNYEDEEEE